MFRFRKRNKSNSSGDRAKARKNIPYEPYFGEVSGDRESIVSQSQEGANLKESGELLLLQFIKNRLGTQAEGLAIRLMNKNPIKDGSSFTYQINQSTEESDLQIVLRDLLGGRLYRSGAKYVGPSWANFLYGDKFTTRGNKKQTHELLYVRTSCSCIICLVNEAKGESTNSGLAEDIGSAITSSSSYTPENSAMANFVRPFKLPKPADLKSIGGLSSWRELEIGTIVRLNSRNAAKLRFTDDMKNLFCHFSYAGPLSHEQMYRKITTIGVDYYVYNKGKKERKVYLQGDLIQLSLEMGIVKLGTKPLRTDEVGAYYLAYRRQMLKIYVGELVLEGNSFGSFIPTGIRFYVGVGEEGGCAPIYSNNTLGPARRLGINELLLHHHMVDDLKVRLR